MPWIGWDSKKAALFEPKTYKSFYFLLLFPDNNLKYQNFTLYLIDFIESLPF